VDTCGGGTFSFLLTFTFTFTFTFTWGLGLTKNHLKTSPRKKKRNTQPHPALDPPAQRGSKKKKLHRCEREMMTKNKQTNDSEMNG